jgi:hypothetical protein
MTFAISFELNPLNQISPEIREPTTWWRGLLVTTYFSHTMTENLKVNLVVFHP